MDISPADIQKAVKTVAAFVLSVSFHEFGHAWMANRLGDRLPRSQGRLTLWPPAHIDPLGTLLMPLAAALAPGNYPMLAWGKPVQTDPSNYTARIPRRTGHVLVSVMGPALNLVLAFVVSLLYIGLQVAHLAHPTVNEFLLQLVHLNILLMVFNLLPIPPLDGGAVLGMVLPQRYQFIYEFLRRYGIIVILFLVVSRAMGYLMLPSDLLTLAWYKALFRIVPL